MDVRDLPTLNALLNLTSACLILTGFYFIRRKEIVWHRRAMVAAVATSSLFLISYLYYHSQVGSVPYQGVGWVRILYFTILISHIILAGIIVPMVLGTVYLAVRGRLEAHRRLARWTFPTWMYVSFTGVAVYVMLYRF